MKRATFLKASLISKGIIATLCDCRFSNADDASRVAWTSLLHKSVESTVGLFMVYLLLKYRKVAIGVRWTFD